MQFILCGLFIAYASFGQQQSGQMPDQLKQNVITHLNTQYTTYKETALQIWNYAEMGYKEKLSSALLMQMLRTQGFRIDSGVAEMPTAFIAEYGAGKPIIGILAEYDALPGLAQQAVPVKTPIDGKISGHGCGHHLFGVASVAAAIEIKQLIETGKLQGTIRLYGCPAEEGGSGKVYMVRAGLFDDVDAAIHWHPDDANAVSMNGALSNISAKFTFSGIAAHASAAPDKGRSALDGVESMNYMVNMMREHIPSEARIHYIISNGGKAPNIVPDKAEVYYYVRHPDKNNLQNIFNRVVKAAEGAAMGTETTVSYEIMGGTYDLLINHSLAKVMQQNLEIVGGVSYTDEEIKFAETLRSSFQFEIPPISKAATIDSLIKTNEGMGSTDVGDVSYTVPTVGMRAATWVPGTPAHSWQAVACGGTEIGSKGMMVAAKTMALTAIDLFANPLLIQEAKAELIRIRGNNFQYKALLGNRKPALNYRD